MTNAMGNVAKSKKAIKIDVALQQVYEVEIQDGLQAIYDAIGNGCGLMERAGCIPNENPKSLGDDLYVDEEGYIKGADYIIGGFQLNLPNCSREVLANNGLILGTNLEGESCDCDTDVELVRQNVKFFVKR